LKTDMKKIRIVISLPGENKYLADQAAIAEVTADRLQVDLEVINAHSDPVSQSQQLLEIIQSPAASRPDAIIVEPATETGLPRVADAAVTAGIGWVVSNARVDYLEHLRRNSKAPVFSISQDHSEIGRMQGRQFGALLPEGGTVLYLRGPGTNYLAAQRAEGMEAAAPRKVRIKSLKIQWTEENCYQSVSSWLRLGTVRAADMALVSSQNTDFVNGARRAFQGHADSAERAKWLGLPCTGAGILSQTKSLVDRGVLAAAVVTSLTMDNAIEMLVKALQGGSQPPEHTFVPASSYPSLDELARKHSLKLAAAAAGK
jgi:ABC-type sugar transport system substrate-binding protein